MNTPQPLPHAGRQPAPRDALLVEELLDAIPDPIIGSDADGTVVYWSRAASEVYGYSAAEALGRGAISLLRTQVPLPVLEIMEELSDVGEWQGRLVQVDSSGREREVESRWVARRNEAGEVAGVFRIERELAAVERQQLATLRRAGSGEVDEVKDLLTEAAKAEHCRMARAMGFDGRIVHFRSPFSQFDAPTRLFGFEYSPIVRRGKSCLYLGWNRKS